MAKLNWNGAKIAARTQAASVLAVDRTMSEAVIEAKAIHPWHNVTGFTEGSIAVMQPATVSGEKVSGRWGSSAADALDLELGTSRIGPTVGEREAASPEGMWTIAGPEPQPGVRVRQDFTILPPGTMPGQGDFVTLHRPSEGEGPLMEARPYLRPAADAQYKLLGRRIGQAFRGEDLT
jgi:hypothetical protein